MQSINSARHDALIDVNAYVAAGNRYLRASVGKNPWPDKGPIQQCASLSPVVSGKQNTHNYDYVIPITQRTKSRPTWSLRGRFRSAHCGRLLTPATALALTFHFAFRCGN